MTICKNCDKQATYNYINKKALFCNKHGTWNMEHGTWNMEHGT